MNACAAYVLEIVRLLCGRRWAIPAPHNNDTLRPYLWGKEEAINTVACGFVQVCIIPKGICGRLVIHRHLYDVLCVCLLCIAYVTHHKFVGIRCGFFYWRCVRTYYLSNARGGIRMKPHDWINYGCAIKSRACVWWRPIGRKGAEMFAVRLCDFALKIRRNKAKSMHSSSRVSFNCATTYCRVFGLKWKQRSMRLYNLVKKNRCTLRWTTLLLGVCAQRYASLVHLMGYSSYILRSCCEQEELRTISPISFIACMIGLIGLPMHFFWLTEDCLEG